MCMFGVGREGVRMGKRVIGRTDAILILLYGDQTKGLSFNWTISTDHLSLRARLGQCYVQLHNRTVFVVIVFFGGVGDGGRGGEGEDELSGDSYQDMSQRLCCSPRTRQDINTKK